MENKLIIRLAVVSKIMEAAAAACQADVKGSRPILGCVNITVSGNMLTAIATDAARLHRVRYQLESGLESAPDGFVCNIKAAPTVETLKMLRKALIKSKGDASALCVSFVCDGENCALQSTSGTFNLETVSGDYPFSSKYGESFFDSGDTGAMISFNPSFIADLGKAAKSVNDTGAMVTMHAPKSPLKPFIINCPVSQLWNIKLEALITPMRDIEAGDYPGFNALKNGGTSSEDFKKLQDDKARMDLMQKTLHELTEKEGVEFRRLNELESENQKLKDQLTSYKNNTNKETSAPDPLEKRLAAALDRLQVLESKAATIEAENKQLKADNAALKEAASKQPEKEAEQQKKTDGGQKPATEKQLAYIRKLDGETPDGLTIRAASIIITQLKRGDKNSINRA